MEYMTIYEAIFAISEGPYEVLRPTVQSSRQVFSRNPRKVKPNNNCNEASKNGLRVHSFAISLKSFEHENTTCSVFQLKNRQVVPKTCVWLTCYRALNPKICGTMIKFLT